MLYNVLGWHYQHVHEYLEYIRPRLEAIRTHALDGDSENAARWHREFMEALHNRINRKAMLPIEKHARRWRPIGLGSHFPSTDWQGWRKLDSDYQISLWRDSRRVRDIANRIRVYQFETQEARSRFSDRLSKYDD